MMKHTARAGSALLLAFGCAAGSTTGTPATDGRPRDARADSAVLDAKRDAKSKDAAPADAKGSDAKSTKTADARSAADAGGSTLDRFGISQLFPTVPKGREWTSNWNNGKSRTIQSGGRDPDDSMFIVRGDGSISIDGAGVAKMTGAAPRMYVYDEARRLTWRNVEVTFYAMRVQETSTLSYQGFVAGTRSNHQDAVEVADGSGQTPCKGLGYYGKFLYDGRMVFQKEILHHAATGYSTNKPNENTGYWSTSDQSLPKNTWVGFKLLVRNVDQDRHVQLDLYRDTTGGKQGGKWVKVIGYVDRGGWTNPSLTQEELDNACPDEKHTVDEILVNPGHATFIRNDNVADARYRAFSIREISPLD